MDIEGRDADPSLPIVTSKWIKRLLFLGTGTSGQVPALGCLLHKPSSVEEEIRAARCVACHDAIRPGSKNKRGCTSAAIIGQSSKSDQESLVLIDCGPSFYTSILQHIDAQKLGRIDAILLTHAHADALLGLDSLRSWTMGGVVQDYVDVYCTEECFGTIRNMFPYLVDKSKSTGGGGVGDVRFYIIDSHKPFQVDLQSGGGGDRIEVKPLPVHHGQIQGRPFECLGFRIDSLSYISDCHYIPPSTVELMAGSQVIVMDALNPYRHASHFSLPQALSFTLSFPSPAPRLALLTDITHNLEHYKTEREVQAWREKLQAWRIDQNKRNQGRAELATAQVGKGEAGGPRWWHGKWDERLSERRGAGLVLLDDTPNGPEPELGPVPAGEEHNNHKDKQAAARRFKEEGEDLLLPQIHLAWDGMLVPFQIST